MEDNPLKAFLNISKPKGRLVAECKIAAESIKEVVSASNLNAKGTPLSYSYFISVLNTLEQLATKQGISQVTHESFIVLLSLLVQKLPAPFFDSFIPRLLAILKFEKDHFKNSSVVIDKYILPILSKICMCNQADKFPFDTIKSGITDERRTVRRMATKCMCKLLTFFMSSAKFDSFAPLVCRDLEEFAINAFNKFTLSEEGTIENKEALYVIYFFGVALQILPVQVGTNLMSHFYKLLEQGINAITIPTYLTIETFMASKKLPTDFAEHVLKYLLENSPTGQESKDNDVLYISYMQSLVQTLQNLNRSGYADSSIRPVSKYFPAFIINMSELLVYPSVRVSKSAYNSLQSVFNSCLAPDFFKKNPNSSGMEVLENLELTREGSQINYLAQTTANLSFLMTERFEEIIDEIMKLIGLFAEKLGPCLTSELHTLIPLIESKIGKSKEWKDTLGQIWQSVGSANFMKFLPLQLLEADLNSTKYDFESRSYLLPIGKKWVLENSIFFAEYLLPLTKKLVAAAKKEESELKSKKMMLLVEQIWALFPNYCESAIGFESSFTKLMPTIKLKLGQENSVIIQAIALGFSKIIDNLIAKKNIGNENYQKCLELIKNIATEHIQTFIKIFMSYHKDMPERKEILSTISHFSQCLESVLLDSMYENLCKEVISKAEKELNSDEIANLCKQVDILSALTKGISLNANNIGITKQLVDKYINHYEYSIQKKMYSIIHVLVKKSGANSLSDAINIYKWIENTKQPVAKIGRVRVISAIIQILHNINSLNKLEITPEIENLINSLLPELIICVKAKHKKTKDETLEAITTLSHILAEKENGIVKLFTKLMAGLAGKSTEFRISTITLLGRLLFEHHDDLKPEFCLEVTNVVILLLKDPDKTIVKEVMDYVKILVSVLPKEKLEKYIEILANGLLVWTGKYKQTLRMKIRYIFSKLIKKMGAEAIKSKVVETDKNLIDYIVKMQKREKSLKKKKRKAGKDAKKEEKNKYEKIIKEGESESDENNENPQENMKIDEEDEDFDENSEENSEENPENLFSGSDSDIPEEEIPIISEEKKEAKEKPDKKQKNTEFLEDRIEKMMNAPESELDTHFFKGIKTKKKTENSEIEEKSKEKSAKNEPLYLSKETGKIVVKDEELLEKQKAIIKAKKRAHAEGKILSINEEENDDYEKLKKSTKNKKDLLGESESDSEIESDIEMGTKKKAIEEKGTAKVENIRKPKKKVKVEGHFEVHTGEEYKGKGGKGDAWKKGQKFEPFAYIRFNPKVFFQ